MNRDSLQSFILSRPGASEEYPFGAQTLVAKVGSKMFALLGLDDVPLLLTLKCDPDYAEALRAEYAAIIPGYHLNKRHWNSITLDGSVPDALLLQLIDHSYGLVRRALPKAMRAQFHDEE